MSAYYRCIREQIAIVHIIYVLEKKVRKLEFKVYILRMYSKYFMMYNIR